MQHVIRKYTKFTFSVVAFQIGFEQPNANWQTGHGGIGLVCCQNYFNIQ